MKKLAVSWASAFLASSVFCGCIATGPGADDHTLAKTPAEGAIGGRPTLGIPIAIPGHATCLIPFSLETRKGWFQDQDPYSRGGYVSGPASPGLEALFDFRERLGPGGPVRWHNAIVRDLASDAQWMILSQRGVIGQWRVFGRPPRRDEPFRSEAIVFIATIDDSNKDGLLNDLDAAVAILADGDGRNPRTVTPPGAQVWGFSYDDEDSRLYLLVVADTNADGEYTNEDAPLPYVLDIRTGDAAAPALSADLRQRAEALLK